MAKIDLDGDGKPDISLNLVQIISIFAMFASVVGSYYTLSGKIEALEAKVSKVSTNQHNYCFPNMRKVEADIQKMKIEQKAFEKDIMYLFEKKRK
jgi:outer membrane murein-binding lipoprotein Lpp